MKIIPGRTGLGQHDKHDKSRQVAGRNESEGVARSRGKTTQPSQRHATVSMLLTLPVW